MSADPTDPAVVHTVAVTVDDAVAAHEANQQTDADTLLRVTRPFSGRMRARLHRLDAGADVAPDESAGAAPVHVRPADLFDAAAPAYPHPDDTEDELRADPGVEYTRERHRQRHEAAVAEWRGAVRDHLVDAVALRTPDGGHEVDVVTLE